MFDEITLAPGCAASIALRAGVGVIRVLKRRFDMRGSIPGIWSITATAMAALAPLPQTADIAKLSQTLAAV